MATSSHALFICACVVTLASLCASQGCTNTPDKCTCDQKLLICSGLDKFPPHDNLDNYETFIFNNCNFKSIGGENIPDYANAKSLILSYCKIETFQIDAFNSLINLEHLSIMGNLFRNISKEVLFPPKISQLTLESNDLSSLPSDVFEYLPELTSLLMKTNKIASLPENLFSKNPKLSHVDLGFNYFEEIPTAALLKVKNTLNRLVLSGNKKLGPLQADMFKDFPELEYLDLAFCEARTVDVNTFRGLPKLRTVLLGNNLLEELPKEVFTPVRGTLKDVWLENNRLTTLENGTLPLHSLTELYLGFNPWHCDEKLAWLKDLHLEKIDHENVTCATPERLAGQFLANVTRDVLNEQPGANPPNRRSMIAAAVAIPIIVLCVLAILCIVLRLVQNRRQQKRAQVRYSAVYRDTVESAPKGHHRPTSNI